MATLDSASAMSGMHGLPLWTEGKEITSLVHHCSLSLSIKGCANVGSWATYVNKWFGWKTTMRPRPSGSSLSVCWADLRVPYKCRKLISTTKSHIFFLKSDLEKKEKKWVYMWLPASSLKMALARLQLARHSNGCVFFFLHSSKFSKISLIRDFTSISLVCMRSQYSTSCFFPFLTAHLPSLSLSSSPSLGKPTQE